MLLFLFDLLYFTITFSSLYFVVNPNITVILQGVDFRRRQNTIVGVRKAPWTGIEDTPGCATTSREAAKGVRPPSLATLAPRGLTSYGSSIVSLNNSSCGGDQTQIKEELAMIIVGALPPCYKDLVSTSVHLTPPRFHKGVQRCH